MDSIQFQAELLQIRGWTIIQLPQIISNELPSRGMVMVEATIHNVNFKTPLEPDGMGSHWFKIDETLCKELDLVIGNILLLSIKPIKIWIEPEIPEDLNLSIYSLQVQEEWNNTTTKAHWEWIRWIRSTNNPQTRQKRIETTCSMLASGKKRPCCFDHTRCTEPFVSNNGILITDFSTTK